jgi:hypothetical protein
MVASQIHNTAGRLKVQNRGSLYKKIDYGFGKTQLRLKKEKHIFPS